MKNQESSILINLLKFQNISMRFFGIYQCPTDPLIWKLYCTLILILLWYNSFKFGCGFIPFYHKEELNFNVSLMRQILTFLWLLCCSVNGTILFIIQKDATKMLKFRTSFDKIFNKYHHESETRYIKAIVIVITSITLVLIINNIILVSFGLFVDLGKNKTLDTVVVPYPFYTEWNHSNVAYRVFCEVLMIYSNGAWLLIISYYFSHCFTLFRLLDCFNEKFKLFCHTNEYKLNDDSFLKDETAFEELSKWYLELCDLIKILDSCFKNLIAFSLWFYSPFILIFSALFSRYNATCNDGLKFAMLPYWLVAATAIMFILAFGASRISTKAHQSSDEIFNIQVDNYSHLGRLKVHLKLH